ncbi:MAG: DTW domain-containing protein [Spirochaetales bacterium]|nr:DTW domain-containing protein [Spirochaetales bacterium]
MSPRCLQCFRPVQTCYCRDIIPVDPGIKFVFLMHPNEAYRQKTGTGRLASLSLINSEIIIDKTFDENRRTQALIANPIYYPMVLYPGKDAGFTATYNFQKHLSNKTLLIFLIDATWIRARKMMFRSPSLQKLPKLSFSAAYRSRFDIKQQPEEYCLSTIESSYYLIKELQEAKVCPQELKIEGMMRVFEKMVKFQQNCRQNRIGI